MSSIEESTERGYETLNPTLVAGLSELGQVQDVSFVRYTRLVLPLDGFVFWVRAGQTEVRRGVFHYASDQSQDESESNTTNAITFTTDQTIGPLLDSVNPNDMLVGTYQLPRKKGSPAPPLMYLAFSHRGPIMRQAGLYHFSGQALNPPFVAQLLDSPRQIDPTKLIVSNSLPAWLSLVGYNPPWLTPRNPGITLFPSFAIPVNLSPPYGAVHIIPETTQSLQSAPWLSRNGSHYQLTSERVRITLYGCNNDVASDFVDLVASYSRDTSRIGLMGMLPAPRDEKSTQVEFGILAQKKTMEFDISYTQTRINNLARQMIEDASTLVFTGQQRSITSFKPASVGVSVVLS